MSQRYKEWKDARTAAVQLARQLGHDVGIERMKEFGRDGYNVFSLPKPQFRFGFELRCEVVTPTDPL